MRHILIMTESCEVRVTKQRPQRKVFIQRCVVLSTSLIVQERSIKICERSSIVFPQEIFNIFFSVKLSQPWLSQKFGDFWSISRQSLKKVGNFFFLSFSAFFSSFQSSAFLDYKNWIHWSNVLKWALALVFQSIDFKAVLILLKSKFNVQSQEPNRFLTKYSLQL